MALFKIRDFDPNYKENFNGYDIKGLEVYSSLNYEKIGTVDDLLVDQTGSLHYLVVDLGFQGYGKKVFLPMERSQIDPQRNQVYAIDLTKEQAQDLPEFSERLRIDNQHEDQGGDVYPSHAAVAHTHNNQYQSPVSADTRPQVGQLPSPYVSQSHTDYGYQQPRTPVSRLESLSTTGNAANQLTSDSSVYYQQDPALYTTNEQDHAILQRYEEQLRARYSNSRI
ncbi:MAG: hypothetical protein Kow00121_31130 [Elainellaceae cyanobacterium]